MSDVMKAGIANDVFDHAVFQGSVQGFAERLIDKYGQNFMHCDPLGGWWYWTGSKWKLDNVTIKEMAKNVGREILVDAVAEQNNAVRDQLIQRARNALKDHETQAMINSAKTDPRIHAEARIFDAKPKLLNVLTGTIDLENRNHRNHNRNDVITKLANVAYDAKATAPKWERFLARVLPDEEVRSYVQKIAGYSLSGEMTGQEFYIHHGSGANGKSTFFDTILTILDEYTGALDINTLLERPKGGNATPEIASLRGKRMVVTSESESGQHLREALVKSLTGDKYITARELYKAPVQFERTFKIHMHVNHKPQITGTDHGIWRRVRLIPWTVTIPEDQRNPNLVEELLEESSGILNWLLTGYEMYQQEGLKAPTIVEAATQAYREDMDRIGKFLKAECFLSGEVDFEGKPKYWTIKNDLYQRYAKWCEENGMKPLASNKFGEQIMERYPDSEGTKKVADKRARIWKGIGLLER